MPKSKTKLTNNEYTKLLQPVLDYLTVSDKPKKSDVVFVFGSLRLPVVWEKVAELYKTGCAQKILITGGFGNNYFQKYSPDKPEAEVISKILILKGIPKSAIILETKATNILENVLFGMEKLKNQKIDVKKVILVSKPFAMRRCFATFKKQYPNIDLICCPPTLSVLKSADRPKTEYAKRLLGELERLKIYSKKGDLIPQKIPKLVLKTADKIKDKI